MANITINLASVALAQDNQPAVTLNLDLTIGNMPNADGSYTVTAATGTYATTDASGAVQSLAVALAPGSIDGADNELFLNGGALFDLGGITFSTDGAPDGATYVGSSNLYPQDINLFYTGSTTSLGDETFVTDVYGIDTKPATYLIQPAVQTISASAAGTDPSSVVIANQSLTDETVVAQGSPEATSVDATVTVVASTLTGVLLEAQGEGLIDVQAGSTVQDSTADLVDGGAIQFETAFSGPVEFAGAGNLLTLTQPGNPDPITGFNNTDAIDFADLAFNSVSAPSYAVSNGETTVSFTGTENGQTVQETLTFVGADYDGAIELVNDGAGGTDVVTEVVCFLSGTRIRTPQGERPVETLARGDLVVGADGVVRPVSWIGVRRLVSRFADPLRCWPVRVRAGALGEGAPSRDLLLSPDHALLVGDVLAQAGALVNGTSIVREVAVAPLLEYFHVETDDHALILAENTPAETFIDNVDRMAFDNWGEHQALYPEGKPVEELALPRAKSARQIPRRLREAIAERGIRLYGPQRAAA